MMLAQLLNVAAVVVMSVLVLDVVWGVVTRYLVGDQAKWTEELARFLLIWVSLLGGAIAYRGKEHLGIDFVVTKFDPSVRKGVALFTECLVCFVAVAVLIFGGVQLVRDALVLEQMTPALGWKMGHVYFVIPIVGVFMLLFSIESILTMWRSSPDELFEEVDDQIGPSNAPGGDPAVLSPTSSSTLSSDSAGGR
jgi:TRAP-type C4-dicarboxylate transport system permease small subunit